MLKNTLQFSIYIHIRYFIRRVYVSLLACILVVLTADSYNWFRMPLGILFSISDWFMSGNTVLVLYTSTFDAKVKPDFFARSKSDIRFLTLTKHLNLKLGCDFGLFEYKNVFFTKFYICIVLLGFIRECLMPKLRPYVRMHFARFIGYVFTLFFASEKFFVPFRGT